MVDSIWLVSGDSIRYIVYRMSKSAMLSDEAYARIQAAKLKKTETISAVILRHVAPPIRTFGDLEKALDELDGPLIPDLEAVERVLRERRKRNGH
jgi:hypothetical protein